MTETVLLLKVAYVQKIELIKTNNAMPIAIYGTKSGIIPRVALVSILSPGL